MARKLNRARPDALSAILPLGLASYVCLRIWLDPDFVSMDYSPYLQIFNFISQSNLKELIDNALGNLPRPYILVNGYTNIEIGFGIIIKILSNIGLLNYQIFAIIAGSSVLIHQYVLYKLNSVSIIKILTFIYSAILLETNAIRAALSLSLLLYFLYIALIKRRLSVLFLVPICFLIHFQSAVWVVAALAAFACVKISSGNVVLRAALLLILVFSATLADSAFNVIFPDKFDSYSGIILNSSGWTPLNAFAAMICATSFWIVISWNPSPESDLFWKYWISGFAVFFQATVFLVYNTTFGAVGQRIWQFAFIIFLVTTSMCVNKLKYNLPPGFKYVQHSMTVLLFLLCYNVLFRYPLSNIFYPLTPSVSLNGY